MPVGRRRCDALSGRMVADQYETAQGIVFAYRVHIIRYKPRCVETELFESKGAFMAGEGGEGGRRQGSDFGGGH